MSETKHTPGPWAIEVLSAEEIGIRVSGKCVAGYTAIVGTDWAHADQNAEQVVNAHLMAAAPDLLAACEKLLDYVSKSDLDDIDFGRGFGDSEALALIRAAIAKYKGAGNE